MKYFLDLTVLGGVLALSSVSWSADYNFSGDWEFIEHIAGSSKPYSTFELKLTEGADGTVTGSYCFITQSGNRIDCSANGIDNLAGQVSKDGQHAEIHFDSFFGAKGGVADLASFDGLLTWKVRKNPIGDFFYGPYSVTLNRKKIDAHQGQRQVVVEKAYLYPTPSATTVKSYLIKGDYVRLIAVSDDFKFWKIVYSGKNGIAIERWIDCHAIDSCP
ncbi:hypothetical protein [Paraburkholderia youngii]|uniref:hypothetical protein n=1 Tax=Paraburkholderia youngii TaxID=2782701 RepID=UPI003D1F1399